MTRRCQTSKLQHHAHSNRPRRPQPPAGVLIFVTCSSARRPLPHSTAPAPASRDCLLVRRRKENSTMASQTPAQSPWAYGRCPRRQQAQADSVISATGCRAIGLTQSSHIERSLRRRVKVPAAGGALSSNCHALLPQTSRGNGVFSSLCRTPRGGRRRQRLRRDRSRPITQVNPWRFT